MVRLIDHIQPVYVSQPTSLDQMLNANRSILRREARKRRWQEPKNGNLVLLRRFSAEKHHRQKLEPQWEGLYRLADVAYYGRSGRLLDIHTNKVVRVRASGLRERCHLDDLKVFTPRRAKGKDNGMEVLKFMDERGIKAQYGPIALQE